MSTQGSYEQFLKDFRDTIASANAQLREIPEELSRRKNGAEDWSASEVIGHLIDSAANNHARFVRAQAADDLLFEGYDQEAWVRVQRYNERR